VCSECAQKQRSAEKRKFDSLKRQKTNVRVLARKKTSMKEKRRIVQQRGDFLG